MCRIHGHFDADASPHELRAAGALQRHGGPDDSRVASGPRWGLGSQRLAITDPDGGRQPYDLGGGRIRAVFNGEIYNHADLRTRLEGRGHHFPDQCDGAVLPALYEVYGAAFAEQLDGMFAIALVDLRAEPTMVLATDDAGMKPIYYHWDGRQLRFASELPALLALLGLGKDKPRLWEPALDSYLATKTPFGEETFFEGVRVLPPGTTALCSRSGGLRLHRREPEPRAAAADGQEPGEQVREALTSEVGRLLSADAEVCAITSGGLDSSLVTALMARQKADVHSFNIAYTGTWPHDERHFALEVAQRAGTVHHQVELDIADFPELLPPVAWHLGQPNADPITLSTYALFEAVHRAGFKVALTGDAADEVFAGYGRVHAAVAAPGPWIPAYVDALAAIPKEARERLYSREYRAFVAARGSASDAIAERLRADAAHRPRLDVLSDFETEVRLPAYHLRRVDHLSMAHAVEVRLPFCQRSVSGLARALPAEQRLRDGRGKVALYEAARGLLPRSVLERPKQPFTLPITAMLAAGTPLAAYAQEMLSPARLRAGGLLDPDAVYRLLSAQRARPADCLALAVWSLLMFELWREEFAVTRTRARTEVTGTTGATGTRDRVLLEVAS
ncbi:asparagine synthase (glutamine-hydrolyzing) [Streptacidiphilus sp. P02-A3a]|uniref:asparagine synthase (glutamine-hydrolyzing) n=1 Tax=Streptacidiphilus sp. P02-A3a TaxID=2704468 RepID=UPI0015FCD973|nr:asparagine synthase (glutamine-hydrolyzing) [Streptacidiphilus sp. P02-A3a]QMU71478.1 asparagine synthase (glutamine-hydrolyzing) [Streptacidiphilus sp. P02-A3a]